MGKIALVVHAGFLDTQICLEDAACYELVRGGLLSVSLARPVARCVEVAF